MEGVIRIAIQDTLAAIGIEPVDFVVEHPGDLSHGDYACNVAMVTAKAAGQNPRELAETIATKLEDQIEYVEKIEVAGPGFINFYLARDFFSEEIARATQRGETWGHNTDWEGKTVAIEYTSPNLFKPLHVGNLVGNIIGESVSRLFEVNGATVKRFNYPSDIGLTVAKGVWGLQQTGGDPTDIAALGEAYRLGNEAYEADGAEKEAINAVNQALYAGSDEALSTLREQGIATSKARLGELLHILGTQFDHEITESMASEPGAEIVRANIGHVFKESDGAVVYEGEKVGLHTRVFLNSQGLPTYEAKDVGHFKLKNETEPDWDTSIIVTGNEQTEYFKVVFSALNELYPETKAKALEHIPTGFLTLTTGKMSSRKGNVLTGESILDEMEEAATEKMTEKNQTIATQVAVAALKYQILRHSVGSNIVFDKEKSLSFEGDSGPYLQYTAARINSVGEKATEAGVQASIQNAPETPYEIEKILYRFPEVITESLDDRAPHHLVVFLTELAGAFNTFYAQEKIADPDDQFAPYKLALTESVGQTLKNGLWMLGIEAPEQM